MGIWNKKTKKPRVGADAEPRRGLQPGGRCPCGCGRVLTKTWTTSAPRPTSADEAMPAGTIVQVILDVPLPNAASARQVSEWVGVHFGVNSMDMQNPLARFAPEAIGGAPVFWTGHATDYLDRQGMSAVEEGAR